MAYKNRGFRPRRDEEDVERWCKHHEEAGTLHEAMVEAIRLHIRYHSEQALSLRASETEAQAPLPTTSQESLQKAVSNSRCPVDRDTLKAAFKDILPELVNLLVPELARRLAFAVPNQSATSPLDEEVKRLKDAFADRRMFDDDDDE